MMIDHVGLGSALLEYLARCSVVALAAALQVAFLSRRGRPESASSAALAGLLGLLATPVLACLPWPSAWSLAYPWQGAESLPARPSSPIPLSGAGPRATPGDRQAIAPQREPRPSLVLEGQAHPKPMRSTAQAPGLSTPRPAARATPGPAPKVPGTVEVRTPASQISWMPVLLVTGWTLGAARLFFGLVGLRRRLAGARPVRDHGITSVTDEIRATLGCSKRVTLLESDSVGLPATVGWLRPCILLPLGWRDWTEVELRVVLAHELAHVRRSDYASRLVGRACLIVHFYHPLAHWLADRLRFQQELAADAWGIRLTGGRATYLTTLARMTLRHDTLAQRLPLDRSLPAFDSLFFRRMEMIRNRKDFGRSPEMGRWNTRLVTFGLLGLIVFVATAMRPPTAPAADNEGPKAAGVDTAEAQKPASLSRGTAGAPFDLSHVPADSVAIVAIKPSSLVATEDVQDLLNLARLDSDFKKQLIKLAGIGMAPESVDQLIYAQRKVELDFAGKDLETSILKRGVLIIKSKSPINVNGVQDAWEKLETAMEIGIDFPDPLTAIFGEATMIESLRKEGPSSPAKSAWYGVWAGVERCQVALAFDAAYVRAVSDPLLMDCGLEMVMFAAPVAPIWDGAKGISLGLDVVGDQVEVVSINSAATVQGAETTHQTVQALMTLARNAADSIKRPFRKSLLMSKNGMEGLVIAKTANLWANQVFQNLRVERDGTSVRFSVKLDIDTLMILTQLN